MLPSPHGRGAEGEVGLARAICVWPRAFVGLGGFSRLAECFVGFGVFVYGMCHLARAFFHPNVLELVFIDGMPG